ncbi:penicillin-binding transpeptidase domain-containing protein [Clostridium hydrogenum]|uniref:penicillin-binding transpeptidase domain-containing protein n=1 Tax=Clostridium hydrogenum TaxID=2855764 RepID=UPI001F16CDC6|nr:penicillin-binding transpeptidase domain-containing protein [Clostridium hydrogenum]
MVALKKQSDIEKIARSKRLLPILIMFGVVFFALISKLFFVMIVKGKLYKAMQLEQSVSDISIPAKRGNILDRNNNLLAFSMDAYRVDIDMNALRITLKNKGLSIQALSEKLSPILNMKSSDITNILYTKSPDGNPVKYATLARQINKSEADKIKALNINGIIVSGDIKRDYVNNNFLSGTLGFVNAEGKGVAGVEESYNNILSGTPGKEILETDDKKNQLPYEEPKYTAPKDGKNVQLTIDEHIQEYAETLAQKALVENKAKSVTITVMNPKNGEILAMVNKPDYNPNNPSVNISGTSTPIENLWKNNAVENAFEPGSIFKVITSYAALSENVVNNSTIFYDPGYVMVDGVRINEWQLSGFPPQTFPDIIKNSSNVGFVDVGANLLGKEKLNKYINLFNFGKKTGIDLPGETNGMITNINKQKKVDVAFMAFGQEISVSAVQYLAAFNAVANGGTWIRPHVMKEIQNPNGSIVSQYNNLGEEKILNPQISTTLRGYLRNVVAPGQNGVGENADVPGLDIAGKTGTAQKADPKTGRYAPGKYMASFAGMAPYTDPKITVLVSIDEPDPSKYYAGQVAAPVAHDLFKEIFDYLQLTGDAALK